jgi:hypothetical protein
MSSPGIALQLFVQSLANVMIVAFGGIRHVGFERSDPLEERIAFLILDPPRDQIAGKRLRRLSLLKGQSRKVREHVFGDIDRQRMRHGGPPHGLRCHSSNDQAIL